MMRRKKGIALCMSVMLLAGLLLVGLVPGTSAHDLSDVNWWTMNADYVGICPGEQNAITRSHVIAELEASDDEMYVFRDEDDGIIFFTIAFRVDGEENQPSSAWLALFDDTSHPAFAGGDAFFGAPIWIQPMSSFIVVGVEDSEGRRHQGGQPYEGGPLPWNEGDIMVVEIMILTDSGHVIITISDGEGNEFTTVTEIDCACEYCDDIQPLSTTMRDITGVVVRTSAWDYWQYAFVPVDEEIIVIPSPSPSEEPSAPPTNGYGNGDGDEVEFVNPGDTLGVTKGGSGDLVFIIDRPIADFTGIRLGDRVLEMGTDFVIDDDPMTITLKRAFLDSLDVGTHTLTIEFEEGEDFEVNLRVFSGELTDIGVNPPTGDNTLVTILIAALVLLAGTAGTVVVAMQLRKTKA